MLFEAQLLDGPNWGYFASCFFIGTGRPDPQPPPPLLDTWLL